MKQAWIVTAVWLGWSGAGCSSAEPATAEDTGAGEVAVDASADASADAATEVGGEGGVDASAPDAETGADADLKGDVTAFAKGWAAAVCARLADCCSDADAATFFRQFQSAPYTLPAGTTVAAKDCAATVEAQLAVLHGKWVPSIGRGRMRFDAAKGAACIAAVEKAACGTALTTALFDPKCTDVRATEVFTKVGKLGDTCQDLGDTTFNGECDAALGYCDGPPSKVTDRRCVAWRKPGEQCSAVPNWWFCDTRRGSSCEGGSPSKPGTCSRLGKVLPLGATCAADTGPIDECETGTYCDDATGKCTAQKADGAPCHWNYECKSAWPFSCSPVDPLGAGGTCGSKAFCGKGTK